MTTIPSVPGGIRFPFLFLIFIFYYGTFAVGLVVVLIDFRQQTSTSVITRVWESMEAIVNWDTTDWTDVLHAMLNLIL